MKYWHFYPIISFVISFNCAPIAPVQSARVLSNFSLNTSISYSPITYTLYTDSMPEYIYKQFYIKNNDPDVFQLLPVPSFGIGKHFEISCYLLPPMGENLINLGFNTKINLFDINNKRLFRSFALALSGGANLFNGEWNHFRYFRGGLISGTYQNFQFGEIELVFMPTLFYNLYNSYPSQSPGIKLNEKGVDFTLGTLFWFGPNNSFQLSIGITARSLIERFYSISSYSEDYGRGSISVSGSPWIIQGSLGFRIPKASSENSKNGTNKKTD